MKFTKEQLVALGGNFWTGGTHARVYFNCGHELQGLDCTYYKTGNISSATYQGSSISNSKARKLKSKLVNSFYYDLNSGEWDDEDLGAMFEEANGLNKPQTETNAEAEPKAEVNARAKAIFARMKELNEAQQCVRPGRVKQTGADLEALTVEIGANHLDAVERHLNEHPCNRIAPVNHDGYSPDWALIDAFNRLESGIDGANGFYDGT